MSDDVTILPDGSAFAVASMPLPLPKDHWLYAPRGEWDSERDEYAECPRPILNNSQRQAVIAAARYAIRGATMCGQEPDFDPDALALNMAYALCGPANAAAAQPQEPPRSAPLTEDPHGEHWSAIAKAAEAISASANCGPEQADQFCQAIDRLSAALMDDREPLKPMTPDQVFASADIMEANAYAGLVMDNLMLVIRAYEKVQGIK